MVLIAGGTGTVNAPTGESPAVLDTAQIYDPAAGKFVLTNPMTAHRDRHAAVILPDGKVLIVGGVDTVLVPLVSFPGPAMPWILPSAEILDPRDGRFSSAAKMKTPRDEPTATLLRNGKVLVVGGGESGAELYDPKKQYICRDRRDGREPLWTNRDPATKRQGADLRRWTAPGGTL